MIAAPYEVADDLARVGFDRCSTASNHSYDLGEAGVATTLQALDDAGLGSVGTARNAAEAEPEMFVVDEIGVAHLAYALNSNTSWPRNEWSVRRVRDASSISTDVDAVRRRGAEIVIVSLHVFAEMRSTPTPDDRTLVEAMLAQTPVDLVVMHGPHTVQPMEIVDGVPVFWSLGNLVSGMGVEGRGKYSDLRSLDGLAAAVRFTERADGSFAADASPVGLCQMFESRVVYHGRSSVADVKLAAPIRRQIEACLARSEATVTGLD